MMRIRSAGTYLALIVGIGVAAAGCSQLGQIKAMKAFKDGNKLYAANDFRGAAGRKIEDGDDASAGIDVVPPLIGGRGRR